MARCTSALLIDNNEDITQRSHADSPERPFEATFELLDAQSRRLRHLRKHRGLTQHKLGDLIGVSFQQIHKYETGLNRLSASFLWRLSQSLGAPLEYFFEGFVDGTATVAPLTGDAQP